MKAKIDRRKIQLEFRDAKGKSVTTGDFIKVISEYERTTYTGLIGLVQWNKNFGRYEIKFENSTRKVITFQQIKEFRRVKLKSEELWHLQKS